MRTSAALLVSALMSLLSGCTTSVWEASCRLQTRPQTPLNRPYPHSHVQIAGAADGVALAGEFSHPSGAGPFPGVVLISGSEPTDRDAYVLGHKPFLVLADFLVRRGYAVFRYDVRGFGRSSGNTAEDTDWDFAADAAAALHWLRGQRRVDSARVGYIGHSQGGFKAPVAAQIEPPSFMVLLASGIQPTATLMLAQARQQSVEQGLNADQLDRQESELREIFAIVKQSPDADAASIAVRDWALAQGASIRRAQQLADGLATPWMLGELQRNSELYGPVDGAIAALLSAYQGPVLALLAARDTLVPAADNAPHMRPLLAHPLSSVIVLAGLNHFLQPAVRGDMEEVCEVATTIDPAALERIANWLDQATLAVHD